MHKESRGASRLQAAPYDVGDGKNGDEIASGDDESISLLPAKLRGEMCIHLKKCCLLSLRFCWRRRGNRNQEHRRKPEEM